VDDIVYEVDCALVTMKPGADVDIGANPSAEEQQEALDDGAIQVNNIIHSFRLHSVELDKKAYTIHLKVRLCTLRINYIVKLKCPVQFTVLHEKDQGAPS
jgi:hypothetical protein